MPSPATHLRAPLLWLLLPFLTGLVAARLVPPPDWLGLRALLAGAAAASGFSLWFATRGGRVGGVGWAASITFALVTAGFVLLHVRAPQLHQRDARPPREITVTLRVTQLYSSTPQARSYNGLGRVIAAGPLEAALIGQPVYFSAIRKISVRPQRSGEYILRGVLEALPHEPAEASFEDYLENLGIRQKFTRGNLLSEAAPPNAFQRFCDRAKTKLEKILAHKLSGHDAVRSLYVAMLLGEKAVLSPEQENAFMRSGTFHIFSISGLHVGVIAGALLILLQMLRLPKPAAVIASLLILGLYLAVTGLNPPALRSFLMIAFLLAKQVFRLPGNALAALGAAALVTLAIDPLQLFSTGFQLSYSVVVALVVMGAPLAEKSLAAWQPFAWLPQPNWRWTHHTIRWSGRWLIGSLAAGWAAFLVSVPSGIGYFKLLSTGSLVANLLIVPISSLAIVSGFLSLLCGLAGLLSLSALFNSAAALIIMTMDWLAQHGTRLPGAYFSAEFRQSWMTPAALASLIAVMLAGLAGRWELRYGGYWPPLVLIVLILIFGVKFG